MKTIYLAYAQDETLIGAFTDKADANAVTRATAPWGGPGSVEEVVLFETTAEFEETQKADLIESAKKKLTKSEWAALGFK